MAEIVLFHSVLGLLPGVLSAADELRAGGHTVHTPDLYGGEVFDDMDTALARYQEIGVPEMIARTERAVQDLPERLVCAGFSNGGVSAEYLAATRPGVLGAVLMHAALPLEMLAVPAWPATVPVQVHYAKDDPWRQPGWVESLADSVRAAGASFELFEYPVTGHLFADPGQPEHHEESARLLWQRVLAFVDSL
jgi:dienelactone hydrolase